MNQLPSRLQRDTLPLSYLSLSVTHLASNQDLPRIGGYFASLNYVLLTYLGSNQEPTAYKAGALTIELHVNFVGTAGIEPTSAAYRSTPVLPTGATLHRGCISRNEKSPRHCCRGLFPIFQIVYTNTYMTNRFLIPGLNKTESSSIKLLKANGALKPLSIMGGYV